MAIFKHWAFVTIITTSETKIYPEWSRSMTKKGPVIVLGIGILIALVVSIASYNMLKSKAQKQAQVQETVEVAVAAADMAWGTVLNKQVIKTAPYLERVFPRGITPARPPSKEGSLCIP